MGETPLAEESFNGLVCKWCEHAPGPGSASPSHTRPDYCTTGAAGRTRFCPCITPPEPPAVEFTWTFRGGSGGDSCDEVCQSVSGSCYNGELEVEWNTYDIWPTSAEEMQEIVDATGVTCTVSGNPRCDMGETPLKTGQNCLWCEHAPGPGSPSGSHTRLDYCQQGAAGRTRFCPCILPPPPALPPPSRPPSPPTAWVWTIAELDGISCHEVCGAQGGTCFNGELDPLTNTYDLWPTSAEELQRIVDDSAFPCTVLPTPSCQAAGVPSRRRATGKCRWCDQPPGPGSASTEQRSDDPCNETDSQRERLCPCLRSPPASPPAPPEYTWSFAGDGSGGQSCNDVCQAKEGSCYNGYLDPMKGTFDIWPTSAAELQAIVDTLGIDCTVVPTPSCDMGETPLLFELETGMRRCMWCEHAPGPGSSSDSHLMSDVCGAQYYGRQRICPCILPEPEAPASQHYAGAVARGKKIYLVPAGEPSVGVLDVSGPLGDEPDFATYPLTSELMANVCCGPRYIGGAALGRMVVFAPFAKDVESVGIFDSNAEQFHTFDLPQELLSAPGQVQAEDAAMAAPPAAPPAPPAAPCGDYGLLTDCGVSFALLAFNRKPLHADPNAFSVAGAPCTTYDSAPEVNNAAMTCRTYCLENADLAADCTHMWLLLGDDDWSCCPESVGDLWADYGAVDSGGWEDNVFSLAVGDGYYFQILHQTAAAPVDGDSAPASEPEGDRFIGAAAVGSTVYFAPYTAHVAASFSYAPDAPTYDAATAAVGIYVLTNALGDAAYTKGKYAGALAVSDHVYFIPSHLTSVGVIDHEKARPLPTASPTTSPPLATSPHTSQNLPNTPPRISGGRRPFARLLRD